METHLFYTIFKVSKSKILIYIGYNDYCYTNPRYKEHEVEQDEPVCEMVVEKKCKAVTSESEYFFGVVNIFQFLHTKLL